MNQKAKSNISIHDHYFMEPKDNNCGTNKNNYKINIKYTLV